MSSDEKQVQLPADLQDENRDVVDLWKDALKAYKGIVGFDLEKKFDNVQAMIDQGTKEMNNFHSFRHNDKKVSNCRQSVKRLGAESIRGEIIQSVYASLGWQSCCFISAPQV